MARRTISPETIEQIIALTSSGRHTRAEVAAIVGVDKMTVQRYYTAWLEEESKLRSKSLEVLREERIKAHESTQELAREGAMLAKAAGNISGLSAALNVEHKTNTQIDKLLGVEAALKIEASVDISNEQAKQMSAFIREAAQDSGLDKEQQKKLFASLRKVIKEKSQV